MQKYYLDKALNTAHEIMHAYFDDKDINGVLKNLSAKNFTFIGVTKDAVFNSRETYSKYAESFFDYIGSYEIVDENYSVLSESQDSCLVIVKFKSVDTLTQNVCERNYFFQFNLVGNRLICPHYHVVRSPTENQLSRADCGMRIGQGTIFYPRTRKIKIGDKAIDLTPIENEIFLVLADNLNQPIMPEKICETIRENSELQVLSNVLPMHISNIRRKLRESDESIKIIYVRGKGYCLKA